MSNKRVSAAPTYQTVEKVEEEVVEESGKVYVMSAEDRQVLLKNAAEITRLMRENNRIINAMRVMRIKDDALVEERKVVVVVKPHPRRSFLRRLMNRD